MTGGHPFSEDVLRRSFVAAGEGLAGDPALVPAVVRRVARRRRRRNVGLALVAVALAAVELRLPVVTAGTPVAQGVVEALDGTVSSPATVTCGPRGLRVHRTSVEADRDGAHLLFANDRRHDVEWSSGASRGTVAAGTTADVTLLDPPGPVTLTCRPVSGGARTSARLRITDESGHYVALALSCWTPPAVDPPDTTRPVVAAGVVSRPPGEVESEHGDPKDLTARYVAPERTAEDVIERAGYAGSRVRSFRVRRGDQVWATFQWVPAPAQRTTDDTPSFPNGGWILRSTESCPPG